MTKVIVPYNVTVALLPAIPVFNNFYYHKTYIILRKRRRKDRNLVSPD